MSNKGRAFLLGHSVQIHVISPLYFVSQMYMYIDSLWELGRFDDCLRISSEALSYAIEVEKCREAERIMVTVEHCLKVSTVTEVAIVQ